MPSVREIKETGVFRFGDNKLNCHPLLIWPHTPLFAMIENEEKSDVLTGTHPVGTDRLPVGC